MKKDCRECKNSSINEISQIGKIFDTSIESLENGVKWLKEELNQDPENAAAGATPFLNMFGWILGGWVMCKSALSTSNNKKNDLSEKFCKDKINTSLFYCTTYLPTASSFLSTIKNSYKTLSVIS